MRIEVHRSVEFDAWLDQLEDRSGRSRIQVRIRRVSIGLLGDTKALGGGLHELRVDAGPGYRVYYAWQGPGELTLITGGDKSSQSRDIRDARELLHALRGRNA